MNPEKNKPNLLGWTCPRPLQNYPTIVMGHGAGGRMMADLIEHLFAPAFDNEWLDQMGDSTVIDPSAFISQQLAFTTDSFVVSPLFFPGGNIGELAVYGTVNDLAMRGARPLFLSAGFILEEGLPMETLGGIVTAMAQACKKAGVKIATGDTKVVQKGHGDGIYINTSGIGIIPAGLDIGPRNARPGDAAAGRVGARIPLFTARCGPCVQSRAYGGGRGREHVVPALRPQPADVCAQHHDRDTGGLQAGGDYDLFRPGARFDVAGAAGKSVRSD